MSPKGRGIQAKRSKDSTDLSYQEISHDSPILPSADIKIIAGALSENDVRDILNYWMRATTEEAEHRRKLEHKAQEASIKDARNWQKFFLLRLILFFLLIAGIIVVLTRMAKSGFLSWPAYSGLTLLAITLAGIISKGVVSNPKRKTDPKE